MKETDQIVKAFDEASGLGKKTALATVVHVQGSSYRRPGARMLVTEDGMITGAISGGCLEGDALRKAVLAISQGKNKLVIYDTTDEDDAKLGIQLGCNGIVSILFEPIDTTQPQHAISVLKAIVSGRAPATIITGYSVNGMDHFGTGTVAAFPAEVHRFLSELSGQSLTGEQSQHTERMVNANRQAFFIEYYQPPVTLVIVGAGNDAMPLAAMAEQLGWKLVLVDGRNTHANTQRFPSANKIIVAKPERAVDQLAIDTRTAIVLMTHNYNYDMEMLSLLRESEANYIGLLGPAAKRERLFDELQAGGIVFSKEQRSRVYGPTGLDIGAETPEEIALSIAAEIMTVMKAKTPIHLREKQGAIHHQELL
jgi:xanthine/CO dehydrogenase XdhC/CoxF family maturation factor